MATHSSILAQKPHGQRSLEGYSPRGRKELGTTEHSTRLYTYRERAREAGTERRSAAKSCQQWAMRVPQRRLLKARFRPGAPATYRGCRENQETKDRYINTYINNKALANTTDVCHVQVRGHPGNFSSAPPTGT